MNENKSKVNQEIFTVVPTNGDSGLFPAENQVRMMLGHSGEEVSEKYDNSLISKSEEEIHRYWLVIKNMKHAELEICNSA